MFIYLYVILNLRWDFYFPLQVVASHSGQRCFGVLFSLPVTRWFGACACLQQLRTFWGAHSSQPNPWHSLQRHPSRECLSPTPCFICIPAFTTACVPLRAAQGAAARWALPARLIRRRAVRRMFLHHWSRPCPHTRSTWAGHLLRLQTVRELCGASTPSSSFQKKATFRLKIKCMAKSGRFFLCLLNRGFCVKETR